MCWLPYLRHRPVHGFPRPSRMQKVFQVQDSLGWQSTREAQTGVASVRWTVDRLRNQAGLAGF
jgi:hypothetical protein